MRKFGASELLPDFWESWQEWASVNRNSLQREKVVEQAPTSTTDPTGWHQSEDDKKDPFDTYVTGPWIMRWSKESA